jgi:hypothetical protein
VQTGRSTLIHPSIHVRIAVDQTLILTLMLTRRAPVSATVQ